MIYKVQSQFLLEIPDHCRFDSASGEVDSIDINELEVEKLFKTVECQTDPFPTYYNISSVSTQTQPAPT